MSLLFKAPFTSQPQGAVEIDWSNPKSTGLRVLFHPEVPGKDLALGKAFNTLGATVKTTRFGMGLGFSGGVGACRFADNSDLAYGTAISVVWAASTSAGIRTIIGSRKITSGELDFFLSADATGAVTAEGTLGGSSRFLAKTSAGFVDGNPHIFSFVKRDSSTHEFYRDGVLFGSSTTTSGNPAHNAGTVFEIGGINTDIASYDHIDAINLVAVYPDSALSQSDALALSANPWQLFKPQSRSLWMPGTVSAGGASTVTSDASAAYSVRSAATSDASASYGIRSAITSDATATYLLRTNAIADTSATYGIRAPITSDTSASYSILTAGAVTSDCASSYGIRGAVQSDASVAYELRGVVQSTLSAGYDIRAAVVKDLSAAYALRGAVVRDLADSYGIQTVVPIDNSFSYYIRETIQSSLSSSYTVYNSVYVDRYAEYTITNLSAISSILQVNYFIDGVVPTSILDNWGYVVLASPSPYIVTRETYKDTVYAQNSIQYILQG